MQFLGDGDEVAKLTKIHMKIISKLRAMHIGHIDGPAVRWPHE
jgi:hypothetical protein